MVTRSNVTSRDNLRVLDALLRLDDRLRVAGALPALELGAATSRKWLGDRLLDLPLG